MGPRPLKTVAVVWAAMLAGCAVASAAPAQRPPGVDALVSVHAKGAARNLVTPRLYTKTPHSLLLAFVVARGAAAGERVSRISSHGLHWSRVVRSDGPAGATEVWQARARQWWSGRIVAKLAAAAYPASVTVVAYGGASPRVSAHAARHGHASTPRIKLRPTAGSLIWTVGLTDGQGTPAIVQSAAPGRQVVLRTFSPRHRTGAWIALTAARSSHVVGAAGASSARRWDMVAVDVVVPSLKRLVEEGRLTAFGVVARDRRASRSSGLPAYCPALPSFEVGVQDDSVFLGLQPAMSPERGFELATNVFHARLLRINVIWGQVKRYGWAPYDRAVQMARERCWIVHMTIMPTPIYAESYLDDQVAAKHLDIGLYASFAREVATHYAGEVAHFAIDNEPDAASNLPPGGNIDDHMAFYDNMYTAAYAAVKEADPDAQVIAGEISGKNISEWIQNVAELPSDGIGIHPYGLNDSIAEFVRYVAPIPLLVTEDGVQASHPKQLEQDLQLEQAAKQAGAQAIIFYQLSRADSTEGGWNTGIE